VHAGEFAAKDNHVSFVLAKRCQPLKLRLRTSLLESSYGLVYSHLPFLLTALSYSLLLCATKPLDVYAAFSDTISHTTAHRGPVGQTMPLLQSKKSPGRDCTKESWLQQATVPFAASAWHTLTTDLLSLSVFMLSLLEQRRPHQLSSCLALAGAGKGLAVVLAQLAQLTLTAAAQQPQLCASCTRFVDLICALSARLMAHKLLAYSVMIISASAMALLAAPVALLVPLWLLCFAHTVHLRSTCLRFVNSQTSVAEKRQTSIGARNDIRLMLHFSKYAGALLALLGLCVLAAVPSALAWLQQGRCWWFALSKFALTDAVHTVLLLLWPLRFLQVSSVSQHQSQSEAILAALKWRVCLRLLTLITILIIVLFIIG
jgi:hypothetical protein